MLPLNKNLKLNSSILSIGENEGNIIIIDSTYHLYEIKDGDFIYSKQIVDLTPQHPFSKSCAVSMQGYIAIGKPKTNQCEIFNLKNGNLKHITTLAWHKADIYNIKFSRNGKYLLTGGEDGKAFVFSMPSFNIVNILPPRPDYISNVHFGKISKLIVYSSYDMANCVFDMEQNKVIGIFETSSVVEDIVFFNNDEKIFFVCSNGESGIYNIESKQIDIKHNYNTWLTRTGINKDDNYAYIGARGNILSYLNLDDNTPKYNITLEHNSGVVAMRIINAKLYIGYSNGYLQIFNLAKGEREFLEALQNNNIAIAKEISDENIPLKTYKIYIESMNNEWKSQFKAIKEALLKDSSTQMIKDSYNKLAIFFEDNNKKDEFNNFISMLGILNNFNKAIDDKDYAMAYKIAEGNEIIKNSNEFIELENYFEQIFNEAKLLVSTQAISKANEILKPFIKVISKKDLISNLLKNSDNFLKADKLLKNKHFAEYFALAKNFPPLTNTSGYQKAILVGEQILATLDSLEANRNFNKANELVNLLIKFAPFTEIAQKRKNDLDTKIEFLELYKNNQYSTIYSYIDKYSILKGMPEYLALKNTFNNIFDNALNQSSIGNTQMVYDTLKEYFSIKFWKDKIDSIFNIAYLNEIDKYIKNNINDDSIDWASTILNYVNMFGKNDEIIKISESSNITIEILNNITPKEEKVIQYLQSIIISK